MRVITNPRENIIFTSFLLYTILTTSSYTFALSQSKHQQTHCPSSDSNNMRRDTFLKRSASAAIISSISAPILAGSFPRSAEAFASTPPNFPSPFSGSNDDGVGKNEPMRKTAAGAGDASDITNGAATNGAVNGYNNGPLSTSTSASLPSFETPPPRPTVAYRSLSIDMADFGVNVPVAMWYAAITTAAGGKVSRIGGDTNSNEEKTARRRIGGGSVARPGKPILDYPSIKYVLPDSANAAEKNNDDENNDNDDDVFTAATYSHRISVKRIGELLAGWDFIPEFVSRDFTLTPTMNVRNNEEGMKKTMMTTTTMTGEYVIDGARINPPERAPVVFLAHGFLGSRFDLSHLAEELANQGFVCISPEYPESLASSYPRIQGLDREKITSRILDVLGTDLKITPTSRAIVGHSLGCGTAMSTGDGSWARVLIAGFPVMRSGLAPDGPVLFLSSTNDGAVSASRVLGAMPPEYVRLDEASIRESSMKLPQKAALIFDRPDAPNHISFLADSVNEAMISVLSPLLPLAQTLGIPVLDFDKYQVSRDSKQTADVVIPLVTSYLRQMML